MRYFSLKAIYLKGLSVGLADNFEQINPAFVVIEHYGNIILPVLQILRNIRQH